MLTLLGLVCWMGMAQVRYQADLFPDIQKRTFNYADTLDLDFYDALRDNVENKPLVVLVHGGGFVAGQRDGSEEIELSTFLAQKGYAVASISYRLSRKGKSFGCDCPAQTKVGTYREAVEDLGKAIHYLTSYAKDFKVDPNRVILIGSSAGAETILNFIAMKNEYRFKEMTYPQAKIIGAVSLSGAVLDRDYLTAENAVPTLFFHGRLDDKVPLATAPHHSCQEKDEGYLMLDGPSEIIHRLRELNTSFALYVDPSGDHDWADLGYHFPTLISEFLYHTVLEGTPIQREEPISRPKP
ncbi:alpha/beta hydrolase [Flagellimonas beolgyonensis]|uniref:alpha/beta hydrolase n=1 Tax=Flagellimonas beolgyonensis TaxID=864064 RepID=UPI003D647F5F